MPTLKQTAVVLEAAATEMERFKQIFTDAARQLRDADLEMNALRSQAAFDRAEAERLRMLLESRGITYPAGSASWRGTTGR